MNCIIIDDEKTARVTAMQLGKFGSITHNFTAGRKTRQFRSAAETSQTLNMNFFDSDISIVQEYIHRRQADQELYDHALGLEIISQSQWVNQELEMNRLKKKIRVEGELGMKSEKCSSF